jgi:hypothetical protein
LSESSSATTLCSYLQSDTTERNHFMHAGRRLYPCSYLLGFIHKRVPTPSDPQGYISARSAAENYQIQPRRSIMPANFEKLPRDSDFYHDSSSLDLEFEGLISQKSNTPLVQSRWRRWRASVGHLALVSLYTLILFVVLQNVRQHEPQSKHVLFCIVLPRAHSRREVLLTGYI